MIVGTTMFYADGGNLNSPEFGRGGLAATFVADVQQLVLGGATQFDILVEHRNSEDTGWGAAGSFSGITGTGPVSKDIVDIKEIVRFTHSFSGGTPAADDMVHFLMMAPSWRPY